MKDKAVVDPNKSKGNPMNTGLEQYLTRIRQIQPGIAIEAAVINNDGLVNDVVVVNGETVFRFAKGEYGKWALASELRILSAIRERVHLPVPIPDVAHDEVITYPFLRGEPLTRTVLAGLNEEDRLAVAEQMAVFLRDLHGTPLDESLPATMAPVRYQDWLAIRQQAIEKLCPLLMKHQRAWLNALFNDMLGNPENFAYNPCLIHGDLGCYHILFDPKAKRISGIVDFGVAGIGDPANDLACLMQYYGAAFVTSFQQWYPQIDEAMLRRARFYAHGLELQWLLNGLSSGEPFWFAAHLGNARDY